MSYSSDDDCKENDTYKTDGFVALLVACRITLADVADVDEFGNEFPTMITLALREFSSISIGETTTNGFGDE